MNTLAYGDKGLRFDYPENWEFEGSEEGEIRTLSAVEPDGLAFVIITIDPARPDPAEIAAVALETMREDYPDLDSLPVAESFNGHAAVGHDVEFMTLDLSNSAVIRCFRTSSRTILAFGQWSDLSFDDLGELVRNILHSIEETD